MFYNYTIIALWIRLWSCLCSICSRVQTDTRGGMNARTDSTNAVCNVYPRMLIHVAAETCRPYLHLYRWKNSWKTHANSHIHLIKTFILFFFTYFSRVLPLSLQLPHAIRLSFIFFFRSRFVASGSVTCEICNTNVENKSIVTAVRHVPWGVRHSWRCLRLWIFLTFKFCTHAFMENCKGIISRASQEKKNTYMRNKWAALFCSQFQSTASSMHNVTVMAHWMAVHIFVNHKATSV